MVRTRENALAPPAAQSGRRRGEAGQGLAEYALIITFVALVVVGALTVLGSSISGPINTVAGKF